MLVVENACQLPFLCTDSLSSVALSNFRGGLLKRHIKLRSNLRPSLSGYSIISYACCCFKVSVCLFVFQALQHIVVVFSTAR